MTNLSESCPQPETPSSDCPDVRLVISPKQHDLGGFSVRRLLPFAKQRMVGPWIFFDHMGPADFPAGEGLNVRPHPHINLATVTYLFDGEILHRDSLGSKQVIRPGDINLMVAGKGITHSERERPEITAQAHKLHGLQLWLALPEEDEETEPAFFHYAENELPRTEVDGVAVRVMMGTAYGQTSPVKTFADTLYLEARLEAGQSLSLPDATEERAVYIAEGAASIDKQHLCSYEMAVLNPRSSVTVTANEACKLALIGGEKLSHRHIHWNFVSSRKQRIEQARNDWKEGRFANVVGDEEEFIPLPD